MGAARRFELAERVREHRLELERTLDEVAARGTPLTKTEARLILKVSEARLGEVERELRGPPPWIVRYLGGRPQQLAQRLHGLWQPRLGRLRHYEPRALLVPAGYARTRAPQPAPPISIVTPSFQQGRFIGRSIQSVVGQRYPALEYVVQDGGSTDSTLAILESYDDRITRWVSAPDDGHADALNRGFCQTNGEIMGWLNSDDLLLPGALAYVARYFAAHPDVDVVYGNRVMIDEDDHDIGAWVLPAHDDDALLLADFVPQETLFWRRRIWDAAGSYVDESFEYALDWDLLLRFRAANARMVRLPRFLGAFRVHDSQRTSAELALGLDEMARLRQRTFGRPVSLEEVNARLRPYLRRHVRTHLRQRLAERFGGTWVPVDVSAGSLRIAPSEDAAALPKNARS